MGRTEAIHAFRNTRLWRLPRVFEDWAGQLSERQQFAENFKTCHSEGGVCPRNLLFLYFDKKQIPHFVRYDKFGAFPKLLGLIPFSRVTAQANGAELPSPMS